MKDITVILYNTEDENKAQECLINLRQLELPVIIVSKNQYVNYKTTLSLNDAIKETDTNFVCFITPDVVISNNELNNLSEFLNNKTDIIIAGYCFYSNETKSTVNSIITNNLGMLPLNVEHSSFSTLKEPDFTWNINNEIFNKFYRKDFLIENNIGFKDSFEKSDFVFNFETLLKANNVCCIKSPIFKKDITKDTISNYDNLYKTENYLRSLLPNNEKILSLFNKKLIKYYESFCDENLTERINYLQKEYNNFEITHSKLTVIPTFYNVAPYVKDCLESLINQSYKDMEILCIDDCSTDNTVDELEKFAKIDSRIKVIKREKNGGAASARNTGLRIATGDFITFIDGDDFIHNDTYKLCVEEINKKNCDFVMYNTMGFDEKAKRPVVKKFFDTVFWKYWDNPDYALCSIDSTKNLFFGNLSACNKVYRKSFLDKHNIEFEENVEFEDYKFHAITMLNAKAIGIVDHPFYVYRTQRTGSICDTIHNSKKIYHLFDVFDYMQEILDKNNLNKSLYYSLLEFEYEMLNFWYSFVPFFKSKALFDRIKNYFEQIDFEKLDYNIYSKFTNYDILMDFLSSNWVIMYFKSRYFNGSKNIIKHLKKKIDEM